jgi:anti-anti-sigma regulatory factor
MLRISQIQESETEVLLQLDGKIAAQWAALLEGVCRGYLRQNKSVQLQCAHVTFIDARGVDVLNGLPRDRVTVSDIPALMDHLLRMGRHA